MVAFLRASLFGVLFLGAGFPVGVDFDPLLGVGLLAGLLPPPDPLRAGLLLELLLSLFLAAAAAAAFAADSALFLAAAGSVDLSLARLDPILESIGLVNYGYDNPSATMQRFRLDPRRLRTGAQGSVGPRLVGRNDTPTTTAAMLRYAGNMLRILVLVATHPPGGLTNLSC